MKFTDLRHDLDRTPGTAAACRRPAAVSAALWLLLLSLCLAGCSGGGGQRSLQPGATPGSPLAAPQTIAPALNVRGSSYTEADLVAVGADYSGAMPQQGIADDGTQLLFSPSGMDFAAASYAIYVFDIEGYDRNAQIRHSWSVAPQSGLLWLGLAHWDAGRWDMYNGDAAAPLNLATLAPYIRSDGLLLLAVFCLGTAPATLDELRIGSPPPVASLTASPASGFAPYTSQLDASASSDPDGAIVKYEWDLDGDGSFELASGMVAEQQIAMPQAGALNAGLRVTDNSGVSTVKRVMLRAFSEWIHSWGGGEQEWLTGSAYDGADGLYFAGHTYSFGAGLSDMLLLKYNLAGELQWARTWGEQETDYAVGIGITSGGEIVIGGGSWDGGSSDMAVVAFSPEGNLLWDYGYRLGTQSTHLTDLAVYGNDIFLCGYIDYAVNQTYNVGRVLSLEAGGAVRWRQRYESALKDCRLNALDVHSTALGSPQVHLAGASGSDVLYLRLAAASGELSLARSASPGLFDEAFGLLASGALSTEIWLTGTSRIGPPPNTNALLLQYTGDPVSLAWDADVDDYGLSIARDGQGRLLLAGSSNSFSSVFDALLLRYTAGGALEYAQRLGLGSSQTSLSGELAVLGGLAVLGCGYSAQAAGQAWNPASGVSLPQDTSWQDAGGSLSTEVVAVTQRNGTVSTPASAVLDGGGGDDHDALLVLRELP